MDSFFKAFKNRFQDGGQTKKDKDKIKDVIQSISGKVTEGIEKVRDPKGRCKGKIWYSPTPPYFPDPCWRQGDPRRGKEAVKKAKK
jgi:hypothetical protein